MKQKFVLSLFILICVGIAQANTKDGATSNKDSGKDKEVLFSVGDRKVSFGEFRRKYEEIQSQTLNPPPPELFLEDLVRYEVGLAEAKKKNIEKDPVVIERINQEVYKGLVEQAIGNKVKEIKVSEAELKSHYKDNPELRSSHILIESRFDAKPADKEAARKRAQELYDEVRASKRSFEELVKLYSDDSFSKPNAGDIGWQTRMALVPSYYNALMSMKVGEIKGLIETPYGFHILKLTGRQSYDQANKQVISDAIKSQKRKDLFDEYFIKLKKGYDIKVNAALLK